MSVVVLVVLRQASAEPGAPLDAATGTVLDAARRGWVFTSHRAPTAHVPVCQKGTTTVGRTRNKGGPRRRNLASLWPPRVPNEQDVDRRDQALGAVGLFGAIKPHKLCLMKASNCSSI